MGGNIVEGGYLKMWGNIADSYYRGVIWDLKVFHSMCDPNYKHKEEIEYEVYVEKIERKNKQVSVWLVTVNPLTGFKSHSGFLTTEYYYNNHILDCKSDIVHEAIQIIQENELSTIQK